MFPSTKASAEKKANTQREGHAVTIITSGCHFSGKLYCRGASRIGGKIEGEIISEGLLIIEQGATIDANIKGEEVIVQGSIDGIVSASKRLELAPTGRLTGQIETSILSVKEGAEFNGTAKMVAKAPEANVRNLMSVASPEVNAPGD